MFSLTARAVLFTAASAGICFAIQARAADRTLITDVTVVSAERIKPLTGVSVLVESGKITAIGKDIDVADVASTIEGNGRFLTPGLIDSHVHLGGSAGMRGDHRREYPDLLKEFHRREPQNYLAFGFTTLIDVSSTPGFARQWNEHDVRPDLHYCLSLPFANGYGMAFEPIDVRFNTPYFLYDDAQADVIPKQHLAKDHTPHAVIAKVSRTEAICVKTYYETGFGGLFDFPVPTIGLMRAVVDEAHENNLVVLMHGNSLEGQQFAADSGADVLAHGAWHWDEWNGDNGVSPPVRKILDDVIQTKIATQATAQVIYGELDLINGEFLNDRRLSQVYARDLLDWYGSEDADWFRRQLLVNYTSNPEIVEKFLGRKPAENETELAAVAIDRLRRAVAYLSENDATFVFGTDTPSSPTYTNPPGYNGLLEIRRLAELGLNEREIFEALTINNAREFNLIQDVGTIEVGKTANLLLMRDNPLESVSAYDTIETVIIGGKVLDRGSLLLSQKSDD
jgi:imidazolonepropionase-like amidohydrolase